VKLRKPKPQASANQGYQALQRDLANMGFCGSVDADGNPKRVDDYFPDSGSVTAKQFAQWVVLAEGLEPFDGSNYQADFEKLFVEHLGSDVVDVGRLDWFQENSDLE
jgi:hypothetical protein